MDEYEENKVVSAIGDLADSIREFAFVYLVCNGKGIQYLDKHNTFAIVSADVAEDSFKVTTIP